MKKALSMALASAMLFSLLAGCGGTTGGANTGTQSPGTGNQSPSSSTSPQTLEKKQEIKMVTTLSSTDQAVKRLIEANDRIREATNGMVDVQMYSDGQMLIGEEGVEALRSGSAVIILNDPLTLSDYVPIYETICAPYLYTSYRDIEKFAESEYWANAMAEGDSLGFHLITSTINFGARSVVVDGVEIRSVEDCKNINVRVPNESLYINCFESFGASCMALGFNEGVTALETGQVNGLECTPVRYTTAGLYEVMKDPVFSEIKWLVPPCALQVSMDYWMSLPEDVRDLMTAEYSQAAHDMSVKAEEEEAGYIEFLKEHGVRFIPIEEIDVESFREAVAPACANMDRYEEVKAAVAEALK